MEKKWQEEQEAKMGEQRENKSGENRKEEEEERGGYWFLELRVMA